MPLSEQLSGREMAAFAERLHAGDPSASSIVHEVANAVDRVADLQFAREARAQIEAEKNTPTGFMVVVEGDLTNETVAMLGEVWDLVEGNHWRRHISSDEVLDPPKWTLVVPHGHKAKFNASTHTVTIQ